ncbi:MAG: hypothetical protein C4531_05260 [Desulfurivibrio sp.]|nr:MAG: hypothetical protein C4531_05260 [Desulfurivibrio sp.]
MEKISAEHVLELLIEYFEAGNKQTDAVAKDIIETDFEYNEIWQEELRRFMKGGGGWSRIRAPQAELLAGALQIVKVRLEEKGPG